ncbi:fibronectin type III domain-containing protein, partial [Flavobacterium suzhouense]
SNCEPDQWVSGGTFTTPAIATCNAPTNLSTNSLTSTSVNLQWNAPTPAPAQGYLYVYNTVNQIGGNDGYIPQGTIAAIGELTPNTTYYWWVASACEPQQWIPGGSFTTLPATTPTGCNPPTNLHLNLAELTPTSAALLWDAPTPAPAGYLYVYNTVNQIGGYDGWTQATATWLTDLTPNTTYYWWVASECEQQQWVPGGSFTTPPAAGTACNPPTNLSTNSLTSTSVNLQWNAPTPAPAQGYLYVYNTVNQIGGNDGYIPQGTIAAIGELTPNTTYYWWVASACEPQQWIPGGSFTTLPATTPTGCNPPTNLHLNLAELTPTSAALLWDAPTPAPAGYLYVYNTVNQIGGYDGWTQATATWLTDLTPNTTYYWWVASECEQQQWVPGGSFTTLPAAGTVCSQPTNLHTNSAEITSTGAALLWNAAVPAPNGGYYYTYNTENTVGNNPVATTSTAVWLGNLTPNTTYYWWVTSNCTPFQWVPGGSFTTPPVPVTECMPPTNLTVNTAELIPTSATLQWTAPSSVPSGYIFMYNTINSLNGAINGWSEGTSVSVDNLTPGTTYYWWITSECFPIQWVQGETFTTPDTYPCNPPTGPAANSVTDTTANLEWNASAPVAENGYLFVYNTVNQIGGNDGWTEETNTQLTQLAPNTTYYWWVASNCEPLQWVTGGTFTTTEILGNEEFTLSGMKYYPNPVSDVLHISSIKDITAIAVYNMLGQEIMAKAINATEGTINVSNLAEGTYLVKVNCEQYERTIKVIKR